MFSWLKKSAFVCLALAGFFLFSNSHTQAEDLANDCDWANIEQGEKTLSREDFRSLLEKCKTYYGQKTAEIASDIEATAQEKKNLASTISGLKSKIEGLGYQINQSNVMIKGLSSQIDEAQLSIEQTQTKIDNIKTKLATILRLRYQEDQRTTLEILLREENLSDFFNNLEALEMLNEKTQDFLKTIKNLKSDLETQKATMDGEKKDLENLVIIKELQKKDNDKNKKEQEYLLKLTEAEYQKYLLEKKEAEAKVAQIGSKLFELLEVPEGGIKFEDAVNIAKQVAQITGVRASFSLAVLWQETRIGKLQGGCYLTNAETGQGVYIKTGNPAARTMKPGRDTPIFLDLIKRLNEAIKLKTDAFHTPVSCCMIVNGSLYGWGGAMGPAQFIPSTWALFTERIEAVTGDKPANPWNVRDAFLANSLYLKDLGADSQTYDKEISAAMRYFGCSTAWCKNNYGKPVMNAASCLQTYLDKGEMSSACQDLIF